MKKSNHMDALVKRLSGKSKKPKGRGETVLPLNKEKR